MKNGKRDTLKDKDRDIQLQFSDKLTSSFRFGEELVDDVVVVEGPGHAGVLGQLLLDGDADAALGEQPLQLFEGLWTNVIKLFF